MSRLAVHFDDGATAFEPGGELRGRAEWQLASPPQSLELRLLWFTQGRGEPEAETVGEQALPLQALGDEAFAFPLPAGPYSFVGSLITLGWAVELVAEPDVSAARAEFTLAPGGEPVRLTPVAR